MQKDYIMIKDYTMNTYEVDVTFKIDASVKIHTETYDDDGLYLMRAIREQYPRVLSFVLLESLYNS
jgi:hypothetical protein